MIALVSGFLLVLVVGIVLAASVMGWGARVTRCQRVGLLVFAAGMVMAAPARFLGQPVGFPDLMMLAGLALYLLARNLKYILRKVDGLDGVFDDRLTFSDVGQDVLKPRD